MKHLLTLMMLLAAMSAGAQVPTSGKLSETVSWTLTDSVLTISGTGKTPSYNTTSIEHLPWQDPKMAAMVKKIVVSEGITEIGNYLFGSRAYVNSARSQKGNAYYAESTSQRTPLFMNVREIELPSTLQRIGNHAFVRMPISHIRFPEGLTEINAGAFSNCSLVMVILPESIERLGPEAFGSCSLLRAIDFRNRPLKLSNGLLFGAESLRLLMHTSKIKSIEPSTFNASPLGVYNDETIMEMLHEDGIEHLRGTMMTDRKSFDGTDEEYAALEQSVNDIFYQREAANATSLFALDRLTPQPYDAEQGTLKINTVHHGTLLLTLTADEAAALNLRWKGIRRTAQPVYHPDNGRVELQSVTFNIGDRQLSAAIINE